jgi:hypothetical protein
VKKKQVRPKTRLKGLKPFFLVTLFFCLIIFPALFTSLVGSTDKTSQATQTNTPAEFIQPIEFSHKIHIEKGDIPCEFCHIYARRSINSGAPAMASCFGCHSVIQGSDENPEKAVVFQDAIKKLLDHKPKGTSIPWKKIHDVPDFVHFSHKRHVQVGFDCTECHGQIDQHDVLSPETMITDLSMGWCMKCHIEGRATINGKIADPIRKTRGGKIQEQIALLQSNGTIQGSKDCYTCHK